MALHAELLGQPRREGSEARPEGLNRPPRQALLRAIRSRGALAGQAVRALRARQALVRRG